MDHLPANGGCGAGNGAAGSVPRRGNGTPCNMEPLGISYAARVETSSSKVLVLKLLGVIEWTGLWKNPS